jgi:hypothetical protein
MRDAYDRVMAGKFAQEQLGESSLPRDHQLNLAVVRALEDLSLKTKLCAACSFCVPALVDHAKKLGAESGRP